MEQTKNKWWEKNWKKNLIILLITSVVYLIGVSSFWWSTECAPHPYDSNNTTQHGYRLTCTFNEVEASLITERIHSLILFPFVIPQLVDTYSGGGIFAIGYGFATFIFGNPPFLLGFPALLAAIYSTIYLIVPRIKKKRSQSKK